MTLIVEDREIEAMAESLAVQGGMSKADAIRIALRRELDRHAEGASLTERSRAFAESLRARAPRYDPAAADKAFIDSLYED